MRTSLFALALLFCVSVAPGMQGNLASAAEKEEGEKGKKGKKEKSDGGRKVDLSNIPLPVGDKGQLNNYLFVTLRVKFTSDANLPKMQDQVHIMRDALVRAGHRVALNKPGDPKVLDDARAIAEFETALKSAIDYKTVEKLEIVSVDSLKR